MSAKRPGPGPLLSKSPPIEGRCEDDTATEEDECAVDTDETDETDLPAEPEADVTLTADGVDITITNLPEGAQGFWIGLAQTGTDNGWFGEDCLATQNPDICHYFDGAEGSLDEVATAAVRLRRHLGRLLRVGRRPVALRWRGLRRAGLGRSVSSNARSFRHKARGCTAGLRVSARFCASRRPV